MKTVFITVIGLLFFASLSGQQYHPLKLFDLATGADVVTYGTIMKVDDHFFYLQGFTEEGKPRTYKIEKFIGRSGSYRWEPYAAGQRVFVFLRKTNNMYSILSPGAEGELPVINDSLVVDMQCFTPLIQQRLAPKGFTPEFKKLQTFNVGKKKVLGLRFTPLYLYQSAMALRDCYQVILKRPNTFPSFTCFNFFDRYTREKIDRQKKKSKLMQLMYNDMEEAQMKNCK
ncbi:hypothetical protein [Taibaiella koreensis]|uniref:hypothetical protein n=1 Tax=Taibaiella koreensis TaxID=1268548 RepID=UPI000E59ACE2|nr:hypothetical protein [Taibaiella koreensis]